MDVLVVVDMQNDFIDGSLGTKEAMDILHPSKDKIENFKGEVIFTRDTHDQGYLQSKEGESLPIVHCVKDTDGWQLREEIRALAPEAMVIDKPTFGSLDLISYLQRSDHFRPQEDSIELIGLCTDICVVANAILLKTNFYETEIIVDSRCCAGVSPQRHQHALETMRSCQVRIR